MSGVPLTACGTFYPAHRLAWRDIVVIDQQRAGRCIFCGGGPLTGEHLLPCWLQHVLPSDDPVVQFRQIGKDETDRHEWPKKPFREKTNFACKRCNNGWMSDLEARSRPVLEPAIRHEPCTLTERDQAIAAAWAFKTCLVFQATQSTAGPIAPPAHFLHIRRNRRPPPQAAIWIGSHYRALHDPVNSVYVQRALTLEPLDDKQEEDRNSGYLCFLAVGAVSFVVVAHRSRNRAQFTYEGPFDQAIDQLWPNPEQTRGWPPRLMMDSDLVEALTLPPSGFTLRMSPP
ncbi:MAG TPA: hypothetical protein VI122_20325 [Thermoleophilaceae bacterium]